ncbi:MAG: aminodeoxychorismate synthase component I, partial [Candidatus Omnitrophota bacterium]
MNKDKNLPLIEKVHQNLSAEKVYEHFKDMPYSFYLDSSETSRKLGEFSFIGVEPFLIFKSKKNKITLNWGKKQETLKGNPFLELKRLFGKFKIDSQEFPFPFIGGGVGYFSYDLKYFNEPCLETLEKNIKTRTTDDLNAPDSIMCFYDVIIVFDHAKKECFVVSTGFPERGKKMLYRRRARLDNIKNTLLQMRPQASSGKCFAVIRNKHLRYKSNFTKGSYIKTIKKAKEYIKKGDIYQINLSQRFEIELNSDPFDLYKTLRKINPAPFASYLNFGDIKVVSASPERFLKKEAGCIETRPIKGTRPRGKTKSIDKALKKELINSPKDRAENLMIIDLERNDLGRICEYASVRVKEFMTCEKYASVFHLVSAVTGKLKKGIGAIDCLINCFPGGSITGAPKIRSMEIIEELEPVKRSIYTGSIGYISFNGNMDTSIVIRTFIVKGNTAYFQVGGGIVQDSSPEKEYQET